MSDEIDNWQTRSFIRESPICADISPVDPEIREKDLLTQLIKHAVLSILASDRDAREDLRWLRSRASDIWGFCWVCDHLGVDSKRTARLLISKMRERRRSRQIFWGPR